MRKGENGMKITDVKINGMKNPTGYSFDSARVSWKVTDSQGIAQKVQRLKFLWTESSKNFFTKRTAQT